MRMGLLTLTLMITMVTEMAVQGETCPAKCKCGWSKVVICKQLTSISSIVAEIPSDTSEIHIEDSQLRTLTQTDFSSLQANQLLELRIARSQLVEIQDDAFKNLNTLRKLKLNENQIHSVTKNAFNGLGYLHELDLSKNKIQSFASLEMFNPLTSLKVLDLSYNLIHAIPAGLFIAQRNLQILKLEGNHLGNLQGDSFQGLHNLRTLYAMSCDIRNIESSVFNQLGSVDTLDLSYNDLYLFPSHTDLQTLRVLRNLTLQGNKLTSLNNDQFQGLHLDTLDLSKNSLTKIQPYVFRGVGSIRYLFLSFNSLNALPEPVFQPIAEQIINLQLNNNKGLTYLSPSLFNGMHTLTDLNLSSCSLQYLDNKQFEQLHNLHTIDIAGNFLKYLPQSFIEKANLMMHIKLQGNPWHCDCLIKPLRSFLQSPRSSSVIYCSGAFEGFSTNCESSTCASPPHLVGKDIESIQDSELEKCEKLHNDSGAPVTIIVAVVAVIVVLGIIGLVLVCLFYRRHQRGEPLLCTGENEDVAKRKKEPKHDYYMEKKDRRSLDPDIGSLNESDKSYVVRNYFSSMLPDPEGVSRGTPSMTRKESFDSESRITGITGRESNHSSQYSLNAGYRIESAV